jgi:hypothetical protein
MAAARVARASPDQAPARRSAACGRLAQGRPHRSCRTARATGHSRPARTARPRRTRWAARAARRGGIARTARAAGSTRTARTAGTAGADWSARRNGSARTQGRSGGNLTRAPRQPRLQHRSDLQRHLQRWRVRHQRALPEEDDRHADRRERGLVRQRQRGHHGRLLRPLARGLRPAPETPVTASAEYRRCCLLGADAHPEAMWRGDPLA